jgi:hypothetical protein
MFLDIVNHHGVHNQVSLLPSSATQYQSTNWFPCLDTHLRCRNLRDPGPCSSLIDLSPGSSALHISQLFHGLKCCFHAGGRSH